MQNRLAEMERPASYIVEADAGQDKEFLQEE